MKKTLLIAAAALLTVVQSSQATIASADVNFANIVSGVLNAPIFDVNGTTGLGSTYTVGLLAGSSSGTLSLVSSGSIAGNGYFALGGVNLLGVNGITAGGTAFIQIEAWQTAAGSFANSSVRGNSTVFSVVTGNAGGSPPGTPSNLLNLTSFSVANVGAVPEPSVLALGALGGLALLFRRRK